MAPDKDNLFLESFLYNEKKDGKEVVNVSQIELDDFNLFIGNNAQGKSRLFRTLKYVKELLTSQRRMISTNFEADFNFRLGGKKICYHLEVSPINEGNSYNEKISMDNLTILSTKEKTLMDEDNDSFIENFFVPKNIPIISSINENRFKTIKLIREYFLRMVFIDSHKTNEFAIDKTAVSLNSLGTNLASVLYNWSKNYRHLYNEAILDFKNCFKLVKDVKFTPEFIPQLGVKTELLILSEDGIKKPIRQMEWSDGLLRSLSIICLPKTPFKFNEDEIQPPSLICIDEVENGLDFNTLEYITNYLKDYSDYSQMILSSHSPLMGKFIHPSHWQIVKRKGTKIKISKPSLIEDNLEEKLELYRQEYWDFYRNYVSKSNEYNPS